MCMMYVYDVCAYNVYAYAYAYNVFVYSMETSSGCFKFIPELLSQTVCSSMESAIEESEVFELTAISPLDGCYGGQQLKKLRSYLSQYGLIRYRVLVEV